MVNGRSKVDGRVSVGRDRSMMGGVGGIGVRGKLNKVVCLVGFVSISKALCL